MREVFMKKVHQCFVHYEVFVYGDNNPFNATVRQSKVVVSWLSYDLQFFNKTIVENNVEMLGSHK